MLKTGSWLVRLGLIAVLGLLVLSADPPAGEAAKYSVVQCGWGVGKDADWAENASERYNHSALCVSSGSNVWAGVEIRTYTRPGAGSAADSTLGRWRWTAPANTGITNVRGTWWHELRNHFQHRLGGMLPNGSFSLTHASNTTRGMEAFAAGFSPAAATFESRLVCARPDPKRCDTNPSSAAMVRALTITLEDNAAPALSASGSALAGGWLRGAVQAGYSATDRGGGLHWGEVLIDGRRVGYGEHACNLVKVGADVHGREMRPCPLQGSAVHPVQTASLSDGAHSAQACVADFAGNRVCTAPRAIHVDNNPPAAPASLKVVGGEGWRRDGGFEVGWANPAQGSAAPIAGASYRVSGPGGFDSGERYLGAAGITSLKGPELETPGEYRVAVWLRDGAGHSSAANLAAATVRLDNRAPEVAFRGFSDTDVPERIRARVRDVHSGPAGGVISYRPAGKGAWVELPTKLEPGDVNGEADLVTSFPSEQLEPGTYEFRVVGADAVGNRAETTKRLDGRQMLAAGPLKTPTKLTAQLEADGSAGAYLTASFLAEPMVSGRLSNATGTPLAKRELRLAVAPIEGASPGVTRHTVVTGVNGEFSFPLGRSTSRVVEVRFPGDAKLAAARAPDLSLRVTGAVAFGVRKKRVVTGRALQLHGSVDTRDALVPAGGKLVTIQYFERKAKVWRPVVFTRSDSLGRFQARYRFRYITRPATIRLRAVSLPEATWPYAPAVSGPVNVRVVPKRLTRAAKRRARAAAKRALAKRRARRAAAKRARAAAKRRARRAAAKRAGRAPAKGSVASGSSARTRGGPRPA